MYNLQVILAHESDYFIFLSILDISQAKNCYFLLNDLKQIMQVLYKKAESHSW